MSKLYKLVLKHFKNDIEKTDLWFNTKNPLLGNISPNEMIKVNGIDKLEKFILNCLKENNV